MIADRGAWRALLALLVLFQAIAAAPFPAIADTAAFEVPVRAVPINRFRIGSDETRFGDFEFLGGFEMRSADARFGQLSSMRFLTPGRDFIGVADHGYWFSGKAERDGDGRPTGVSGFLMQPILDADGNVPVDKHFVDAEGLSIHQGVATVAFERDHRLEEFAIAPGGMGPPLGRVDLLIPPHELRYNQGIETVARAPDAGHLQGARIVVAERSIDEHGNLFAAILEGSERGLFHVERTEDFDVTDGVFLPDGDLLLLERRFSLLGAAIRVRRIEADDIRAGALVGGRTVLEAGTTHQIDNMETIELWRRADGGLVVVLLSDDNLSFLQRTLYLEFLLVED